MTGGEEWVGERTAPGEEPHGHLTAVDFAAVAHRGQHPVERRRGFGIAHTAGQLVVEHHGGDAAMRELRGVSTKERRPAWVHRRCFLEQAVHQYDGRRSSALFGQIDVEVAAIYRFDEAGGQDQIGRRVHAGSWLWWWSWRMR